PRPRSTRTRSVLQAPGLPARRSSRFNPVRNGGASSILDIPGLRRSAEEPREDPESGAIGEARERQLYGKMASLTGLERRTSIRPHPQRAGAEATGAATVGESAPVGASRTLFPESRPSASLTWRTRPSGTAPRSQIAGASPSLDGPWRRRRHAVVA